MIIDQDKDIIENVKEYADDVARKVALLSIAKEIFTKIFIQSNNTNYPNYPADVKLEVEYELVFEEPISIFKNIIISGRYSHTETKKVKTLLVSVEIDLFNFLILEDNELAENIYTELMTKLRCKITDVELRQNKYKNFYIKTHDHR